MIKYADYHAHLKNKGSKNCITLALSNTRSSVHILLFPIISKLKRKKLSRLIAMTIYCDDRSLSMFKNPWMKDFFFKRYKLQIFRKKSNESKFFDRNICAYKNSNHIDSWQQFDVKYCDKQKQQSDERKNSKYVYFNSKSSIFSCHFEICRFYAIKRSK